MTDLQMRVFGDEDNNANTDNMQSTNDSPIRYFRLEFLACERDAKKAAYAIKAKNPFWNQQPTQSSAVSKNWRLSGVKWSLAQMKDEEWALFDAFMRAWINRQVRQFNLVADYDSEKQLTLQQIPENVCQTITNNLSTGAHMFFWEMFLQRCEDQATSETTSEILAFVIREVADVAYYEELQSAVGPWIVARYGIAIAALKAAHPGETTFALIKLG